MFTGCLLGCLLCLEINRCYLILTFGPDRIFFYFGPDMISFCLILVSVFFSSNS